MTAIAIDCPKDSAPLRDWSAHLTTRSGYGFYVRPAHPGDEAALAALFDHVSPDDLRFRFLSSTHKVGDTQLAALTHVDHQHAESFVAIDLPADRVIASAMLAADTDMKTAEVAISIDSDYKNRGIGWVLLEHVARYARAHGVKTLQSIESRENHGAIELEREMGFTARPFPDDSTLVIVEATL